MKRTRFEDRIGRREFLKRGMLAGVGVSLLPIAGAADAAIEAAPHVQRYATLGRTGLKISDISFGSSRLNAGQENLVQHAFDAGINYFDSAESYTDGESETVIGNALRGKRDKVYLTSKIIAGPDDKRDAMMAALEGSLRRLQTDHIDVYFNHAVNNLERLKNPEWYEFTEQARKQGKIRFTGMSGHAGNLIECLDYAIDHGRVDVILCAYNFGQDPRFYQHLFHNFDFVALQPDLPRVIAKAKSKGVGVVTMKTLMGARLNDMRKYESGGATFSQAAFRWVLSNANVDALIVSMTSDHMIDEYLGASGYRATAAADLPLLNRYASLNGGGYCKHGCNQCESSCPYGVEISEVLRTRMYAHDYRDMRLARTEYAMLASNAAACLTCDAKPCAGACPHGLAIDAMLAPAHRMLTS
ncbi:MAG: aldo/keto reductase [Candidatus Binatus sp.]|uniref:aldo/keto reductase n=1 Tax=Candidatus Binatus sp. TaxID=2811406 RepID=UPI00271972D6|nr:aldo/keto reductase [Candidatus Binatus sp.]MDO8431931.1 aldo/keto reductase [Candidatus Binatus sp.]